VHRTAFEVRPIAFRVLHNIKDEPRDVAVRYVLYEFHRAQGRVEASIYHDSHLLSPTAQRRHLDLKLRHKSLGAAAPIVEAMVNGGKGETVAHICAQGREIRVYAATGDVDCLNLKRAPFQGRRAQLEQHQVDASDVTTFFSVLYFSSREEADLRNGDGVVGAKEHTTYPSRDE
jgi:hypothetical protein